MPDADIYAPFGAAYRALRAALETAKAERDRLAQYHGGHMPDCGGMNTAENTCGCGYLDGTAYRDLVAALEAAKAERDAERERAERAESELRDIAYWRERALAADGVIRVMMSRADRADARAERAESALSLLQARLDEADLALRTISGFPGAERNKAARMRAIAREALRALRPAKGGADE